jgi:hypothetical protein
MRARIKGDVLLPISLQGGASRPVPWPDSQWGAPAMSGHRKLVLAAIALAVLVPQRPGRAADPLDYEVFTRRIEPLFLEKRPGHARCYTCHEESNNAFRLEKLPPGARFWTEEQSRRNFERVSRLVTPGAPDESRLLLHPLAPEAGGSAFHSGGRQFASQSDPAWRAIADWVNGRK